MAEIIYTKYHDHGLERNRKLQIESNSIFKIGPSELLSSVSKRGLLQIDRMDGLLSWTIMYITPDVFKK